MDFGILDEDRKKEYDCQCDYCKNHVCSLMVIGGVLRCSDPNCENNIIEVGGAKFKGFESEEKVNQSMEQWSFIHTLMKTMVVNTVTCVARLRTARHQVFIKRGEELVKPETRRMYAMTMIAFNAWVQEHCGGNVPGNIVAFPDALRIMFTIADKDWAYERLLAKFLEVGSKMTKEDMDNFLLHEKEAPYNCDTKFIMRKKTDFEP